MTDTWIDRVREADSQAEDAFRWAARGNVNSEEERIADALIAIAAELRAQRIARRPGAGVT